MEQEKLRAFVYDRTSRIINGRGTANQDQNTDNERFCADQGWEIVARFTDPGKGATRHSKSKRDDYDRMIERAQLGEADVLVVWEASERTGTSPCTWRSGNCASRSGCYSATTATSTT